MNWGLIGHDWAVNLLKNHITRENIRHAYLFTGPSGIGRRTLALAFTQALNCPNTQPKDQFCGVCPTCKRIQSMQYPDLHIVEAEKVGGVLKVDQIRELQHNLALTPYEGSYRCALILRFDEAHPSASNALLKTLEEPNPRVILILTAENQDQLLPTIVSRCEIMRLRPAPLEALMPALSQHLSISTEDARFLAHISNGRPGTAIQYHHNPELVEKRSEILEDLCSLLSANRVRRFSYAANLAKENDWIRSTLVSWLSFWRDILLKTSLSAAPLTNIDMESKIEALAVHLDSETAFHMIQQIETTLNLIDRNINLRLAVEILLLNMPRIPETILT